MSQLDPQTLSLLDQFRQKHSGLGSSASFPVDTTTGSGSSTDDLLAQFRAKYQPKGNPSFVDQIPGELGTYMGGQAGTISEAVSGQSYGGHQIIAAPRANDQDQALADTLQSIKQAPGLYPAFNEKPWAEQVELANRVNPQNFQAPPEVEAQRAASRMWAATQGQYNYSSPEEHAHDLQILSQSNLATRGQLNAGRARSAGMAGSFGLGAAEAATGGLGGIIRNAVTPETTGLEQAAYAENPWSARAGILAGSFVPMAGGAAAGGRLAAAGAQKLLGEAAGPVAQGAARLVGGLAGQEAVGAGTAFGQAISAGGGVQEGLHGAEQSLLALPELAMKLGRGDDLSEDDILNLAMLLPMYGGIRGEMGHVIKQYRASPAGQRAALGRSLLQDIQRAPAEGPAQIGDRAPVRSEFAGEQIAKQAQPDFQNMAATEGSALAPQYAPDSAYARRRYSGAELDAQAGEQFPDLVRPNQPGMSPEQVKLWESQQAIAAQAEAGSTGGSSTAPGAAGGGFDTSGFRAKPKDEHLAAIKARLDAGEKLTIREIARMLESPNDIRRAKRVGEMLSKAPRGEPQVRADIPESAAKPVIEPAVAAKEIGFGEQKVDPNDPRITAHKVTNIQEAAVERWMKQDPATWPEIVGHKRADGTIEFGDGNHRMEAARRMGLNELPITVLGEGERAAPSTPKAAEGLHNAISEVQNATGAVDTDKMSPEMQRHFLGKAEDGLTYGEAKSRVTGETTGSEAPRANIDRARELFDQTEHVSPAKIKAELDVPMKEAIELAGQLKKERRPTRESKGDKPLPAGSPERTISRDEVMRQVQKDHPASAEATRAMLESQKGDFVERDVPLDKIDLENIRQEVRAGESGINPGKIRRYASEGENAPPVVGVESPNAKGKLFIADGRHRVLAEALRQKESGKGGTVKAHVPAEFAREHLDTPKAPETAKLPEGVTLKGEQKNRAGEVAYTTYQDDVAKTSFSVKPGESVETRMNEARARMGKAEPVAEKVSAPEVDASPVKAKIAVRKTLAAATDPVSPQGIIAKLHADLGLGAPGLGKSRLLKTRALGWILPSPEHIRLRLADDMDTAIHEVGHYLHKLFFQGGVSYGPTGKKIGRTGLNPTAFPKPWNAELEALGRALYGSRKPASGYLSEGWAELTRLIFTDPAGAKKAAPVAFADAMKMMTGQFPEQYEALLRFRKTYDTYAKANPVTKLMGYIRDQPVKSPWSAEGVGHPVRDWMAQQRDRWNMMLFDQTAAIGAMTRELAARASGPAGEMFKGRMGDAATSALRMRGRAYGDFDVAVRRGRFDPETRKVTGAGLSQILAPVRDSLGEWQTYMMGKRALEKRKQGFKNIFPGLTDTDIATAVTLMERTYPEFKKAAKEFQDFNEWLIRDYAVKSGLITAADAEKIISKNLEYITFSAIKSEVQPEIAHSGGPPKKITETGTGIKRFAKNMEGAYIEPPLHAFMASMEGIMTRAATNDVARGIVSLEQAEGAGRWFRKIDRPLDVSLIRSNEIAAELNKRLAAAGVKPGDVDQATMDIISNMIQQDDFKAFHAGFRVSQTTGEFSVLVNGKPQFYEAVHPFLKEFLQGKHSPTALGQAWQWLRIPRNIYRAGATAKNVDFFVVNFLRDFTHAAMFSEGRGGGKDAAIARAGAKWGGILKAIKTGDPGALYELSGASQSGLFQEYIDKKTGRFDLDRMFEKPGRIFQTPSKGKIAKAIKDVLLLEPIGRINERLELANRLGEFQTTLTQGDIDRAKVQFNTDKPSKAQIEQASQARDQRQIFMAGQAAADATLDFQRGGKATVSINQGIPFFNAAFLGGNKMYRYAKAHPVEFAARTASYVVLPSIVSMMMNRNNQKYWNLPYEQRDRYWHFPIGDYDGDGEEEFLRIPKPYGLGVFANMAERAIGSQFGIDPVTGKRGDTNAWRNFGGGIVDQFRPPYTIPIVTPVFELMVNHSLFFGGPIVRKAEQVGPPGERGAERSSEVARALGSFMDVPPPYIDYAISGMFAGLGQEATQYLADPITRVVREGILGKPPLTKQQIKPQQLEFLPVLKRLIIEEPKTNTETLIRFWRAYETADNSFRGYSQRVSAGSKDTTDYFNAHKAEISGYYNIQPFKENLSELFKELHGVYRDDKLGETDRYQKARKIINSIESQARDGLKNLDKATTK